MIIMKASRAVQEHHHQQQWWLVDGRYASVTVVTEISKELGINRKKKRIDKDLTRAEGYYHQQTYCTITIDISNTSQQQQQQEESRRKES
mmetsp:Transcript_6636/g.7340  ORF Transcript_6636/g.7340 Transcript_6636/m.7340 type:complete len:90 (-) Transcript_6636:107-376(-)